MGHDDSHTNPFTRKAEKVPTQLALGRNPSQSKNPNEINAHSFSHKTNTREQTSKKKLNKES